MRVQRKVRSAIAFLRSDHFRWKLCAQTSSADSLDLLNCVDAQTDLKDCVDAQANLNICWTQVIRDIFFRADSNDH